MKQLDLSEWLLTQFIYGKYPERMPNHRRLFETIRRAIAEQILPSGARLPSTRSLALDLGISRNTILAAFEQLLDEGYVEAKTGSGTYVSHNSHQHLFLKYSNNVESSKTLLVDTQQYKVPITTIFNSLSKRGLASIHKISHHNLTTHLNSNPLLHNTSSHEVQPFTPCEDDYSQFPLALWRRLLNRQWRSINPTLLDSSHNGGYLPLRNAIADYLKVSRAVNLISDQVLITAGTQQSIDLCAKLLADHNDIAWVENPCYWAARSVLTINGLKLHPITVDKEGMAPSMQDFRVKPKLIYTTPSHQYPKGMVMSYGRRRLLLDYAQNSNAWIIEDDYDSEFRFEGRPISSLQGMDVHGRVLYLGTFSKVMYPGIRLGYLVVPPQLVDSFKSGLYELQRPGQVIMQAAMADFMEEGHFTNHIRRLKLIYSERRRLLQVALLPIEQLGAMLSPVDSGLHLVVIFDTKIDDISIAELAQKDGLRVYALSNYCIGNHCEKGLIIGYAYAPTEFITEYGNQLAQLIIRALNAQICMR